MSIAQPEAYELLEQRPVKGIHSQGYYYRHKKSGARIAVLSNEDENKVFAIGFRTPPKDDTGVPHILEHSVLCGSDRFPSKDPFVELAKGSLNTFLNAMTYPDKTVYPVASCNDTDFQNLMHVYMDAVFFPNIYRREEIFRQEGWHYELEDPQGELQLNGVVYNEMKGAFSSPDGVLDRQIMNSLFPDNTYSCESGGDPDSIPELSYEEFLAFHKKYYHPSNSYIYLYGNMDVAEKLDWLDREYLCKFDLAEVDSAIPLQKPFEQPVRVRKEYSVTSQEPVDHKTFLSWNKAVGEAADVELATAMGVLDYVLLSAPGAPLRKALLEAGIGDDITGGYDNGILQPVFSVISKNADPDQEERFVAVITDVLEKLAAEGLDKKALEAGVNSQEFSYREADYGRYPSGLMIGLEAMSTWLYHDDMPFDAVELLDIYARLREAIGTDYYEKLIRTWLLDNPHGSVVVVEPRQGLTGQLEQKLKKRLADYKASLSPEEIRQIAEDTKALKAYQEEPSTKEELEAIPLLRREDLDRKVQPLINEERKAGQVPVLFHDIFTNGISYVNLLFNMDKVPEEYLCYAGLLKSVLGYMDTEHYDYGQLFNAINCSTGGISTDIDIASVEGRPGAYTMHFRFRGKALSDKQHVLFEMIKEIISATRLEDTKRLKEIIAERRSRLGVHMQEAGHSTAMQRAASFLSAREAATDRTGGLSYYLFLKELDEHFEERKQEIVEKLRTVMALIFSADNLLADYTGQQDGYEDFAAGTALVADCLPEKAAGPVADRPAPEKCSEGFRTAAKVQYVAAAGDFSKAGLPYTGTLKVLRTIMSYDYLWTKIRVLGGAYGAMNGYARDGVSYLVSYRDPNLTRTLEVYEQAADYMEQFQADERDMTKYVIGTVSEMDTPLQPGARGARSRIAYLAGLTEDILQRERDQVLDCRQEDIRAMAEYLRAIMKDRVVCVLGGEEIIEENKVLFDRTATL